MMKDDISIKEILKFVFLVLFCLCAIGSLTWGACAFGRVYSVWAEGKGGQAELAHAESNRQIKTLEAKACMESAKFLAESEIIRAHGVAAANQIIGDSLKENESYLRYLWIQGLQNSGQTVVYVPTEANLPILEAGKRP